MSRSLLESLADADVPPAPVELDRQVHHRLNQTLLIAQLLDFVFCGIPYVFGHLAWGIVHLCESTLSGRFETRPKASPPETL